MGFTSGCFLVNSILQSNTDLKYSECAAEAAVWAKILYGLSIDQGFQKLAMISLGQSIKD